MEFFQYLPLAEARDLIERSLTRTVVDHETVDLADALGRVAAAPVIAGETCRPSAVRLWTDLLSAAPIPSVLRKLCRRFLPLPVKW
jgi:hypothetical protein